MDMSCMPSPRNILNCMTFLYSLEGRLLDEGTNIYEPFLSPFRPRLSNDLFSRRPWFLVLGSLYFIVNYGGSISLLSVNVENHFFLEFKISVNADLVLSPSKISWSV